MDKFYIFGYTLEELAESLKENFPAFRAKQIYHWLYVHYEDCFDKMVNLPKDLRKFLTQRYTSTPTTLLKKKKAKMAA